MARLKELEAAEREANKIGEKFAHSSDVMGDMSRAYGADFSGIHIHNDGAADAKVRAAGKDAIASGNDIFFGKGIYESSDPASRGLVAHELAHTMQQGIAGEVQAGVQESVPAGVEQGGILDWFKGLFGGNKKKKNNEIVVTGGDFTTDADSMAYMRAMRQHEVGQYNASKAPIRAALAPIIGRQADVSDASAETKAANDTAVAAAVQASNKAWTEKNGEGELDVSKAFQKLGFRNGGDTSKTDRNLRSEMFGKVTETDASKMTGFSKQLLDYNLALMDSGVDFTQQAERLKIMSKDAVGMKYGGLDLDISGDFLQMLEGYLSSEQGLDYMQNFQTQMGGAEVFKDSADPMNFMLQTVLNSEIARLGLTARAAMASRGSNAVESSAGSTMMQQGSGAVLMKLPVLAQNKERYDMAAPEIKALVDQYKQLELRLQQKLAARKTA